MQLYMEASPSH